MTEHSFFSRTGRTLVLALIAALACQAATAQRRSAVRNGDYIVAVVNQELVTAGEVQSRLTRVRETMIPRAR